MIRDGEKLGAHRTLTGAWLVTPWLWLVLPAACSTSHGEPFSAQALLGPIVGARVDVYHLADSAGPARCTVTTTDDPDLAKAGSFLLPADCVATPGLYLLVVTGGTDIDVDDDGQRDAVPTPMLGTLHGVYTQAQLARGSTRITAVTEVAYQFALYALNAAYDDATVLATLDRIAEAILKKDLDGDGRIDHADLAAWHPRLDQSLFRPGLQRLNRLAGLVLGGQDAGQEVSRMLSNPTLGVAAEFSAFANAGWVRSTASGFTVDGVDYELNDGGPALTYSTLGTAGHPLSSFGDFQPTTISTDTVTIDALRMVRDWSSGIPVMTSPPRLVFSDPSGSQLGTFVLATDPVAVHLLGTRLLVLRTMGPYLEPAALEIIDVSDPSRPVSTAVQQLEGISRAWVVRDREVVCLQAVYGSNISLRVSAIDTSVQDRLAVTTSATLIPNTLELTATLRASDGLVGLWSLNDSNALTVLDRATGVVSSINMEAVVTDFDVAGDRLLVLVGPLGLRVVEPAPPVKLGAFPGALSRLEVGGQRLYAWDRWLLVSTPIVGTSSVVSVADPSSPAVVATAPSCQSAVAMAPDRVILCDASSSSELDLYSGSWHASFGGGSGCFSVGSDDNGDVFQVSMVVDAAPGGSGWNVTGASFQVINGGIGSSLVFPGYNQYSVMAFAGGFAYLAGNSADVRIVDVRDPRAPLDAGSLPFFGVSDVAAHGAFLYLAVSSTQLAAGAAGVRVFDISNRTSPVSVSSTPTTGARRLAVDGDRLYVADGPGGLRAFDIAADGSLAPAGSTSFDEEVRAVAVAGDRVWVVTDTRLYSTRRVSRRVP